MLRSDLCDYSNAYIVAKGTITVDGNYDNKKRDKKLPFKKDAPFRSCVSKISNKLIDNAEDLDIAMSMYNLLGFSVNYSLTSEGLWNYYRDEINYDANENNAASNRIKNIKTRISQSFEYKTKLIHSTSDDSILIAEGFVPIRYLNNFRKPLDLLLINCEKNLICHG